MTPEDVINACEKLASEARETDRNMSASICELIARIFKEVARETVPNDEESK